MRLLIVGAIVVIILAFAVALNCQTKAQPPGNLTLTADSCDIAPWPINCVNQINGRPVCPYGRVGAHPIPGQPYTIWNYPKVGPDGTPLILDMLDVNGKVINPNACVYTLPPVDPEDPSTWPLGAHY